MLRPGRQVTADRVALCDPSGQVRAGNRDDGNSETQAELNFAWTCSRKRRCPGVFAEGAGCPNSTSQFHHSRSRADTVGVLPLRLPRPTAWMSWPPVPTAGATMGILIPHSMDALIPPTIHGCPDPSSLSRVGTQPKSDRTRMGGKSPTPWRAGARRRNPFYSMTCK